MKKQEYTCANCGVVFMRNYPKQTARKFCSKSCNMKKLNAELNSLRMTEEVKEKLKKAHTGKGEQKTYLKTNGRHEHRIVAELKLGRKLEQNEVVHHIDNNKRNNDPDNIMIFSSQSEHLKWHLQYDKRYRKGGDAE